MPAYNHERFVAASINSVLEQTCSDLELVIIDDGSTDNTAKIIGGYDDPRLRYHFQDNQDAFNALNEGLEKAEGQFIAIINSDDVYHPRRLERCLQEHESSGARFIFSDVTPINDNGEELINHPWQQWHQGNRDYYFEESDLYRGFLHGNFMVTTSNVFMTRELQQQVGGFTNLRYLHDYDFVFRLLLAAEAQTCYLADERLLSYRIHDGNTLGEAAITGREQDQRVIRSYLLQSLPEASHKRVETAIDRLIALEHELLDVKRQLRNQSAPATPPSPAPLPMGQRVKQRLLRALK